MLVAQVELPIAQRGGAQAIFLAVHPHSTVTITIDTGATYPSSALAYTSKATGIALTGKRTGNRTVFTVPTGASGLAVLAFAVPSRAPLRTVSVTVDGQGMCPNGASSLSAQRVTRSFRVAKAGKNGPIPIGLIDLQGTLDLDFVLPSDEARLLALGYRSDSPVQVIATGTGKSDTRSIIWRVTPPPFARS